MLALVAALSPVVLPAAPAAARTAFGQPATVAHDVVVDLAAAMPATGVERLAGGSFRTTAAVASRPIIACPGFWFTALGVVWHQLQRGDTGAVTGAMAWLDSNGTVLGQAALETDDDASFEPGLRSTDLVWTGGGECARVTLRLPPGVTVSGAHVGFVNTSGSADGPGTGPPDTAPAPSGVTAQTAGAGGGPPMPGMVSRASWGAPPAEFNTGSPGCSAPYYSPIKVAYIHHTSGSNSYSPSQSDDIVRADDWFHTQERGYCDIAYDFLVDRFGTIFVGRAGGAELPVIPGSQAGFNPFTTSVSVMGNFATTAPPQAAISSVERLLAWKLDVSHVPADGTTTLVSQGYDTDRYPPGQRITMHTIEGHRRTSQTDCPGRIWELLPQIRRTVAAMGGPKIYRPTESSTRVVAGQQPVSFAATATDPLRWAVAIRTQGGSTVRALVQNGMSTTLHVSWDGLDANGDPAPSGKYVALIGGTTSGGTAPRSATLQVDVPGPLPAALPVPSGTVAVTSGFAELRDVAATGAADVWAVGTLSNNGAVRPLVRHLGPGGWSNVAAPNPGIHGSGLQAVDALAPDDAWAGGFSCLNAACGPNGGFGSRTLMEHWDGSRWAAVPTPSPGTALNEIRAVDAVARDDVWAAGLWSDRDRWLRHGLVLHWDGSTWRQMQIPFLDGETHLDGISASGPDDAWAVGENCPGPCSGLAHSTAVLLHWDGRKFTRVKPATIGSDRSGLDGVLAVSPTDAWAVGGRSANRVANTHPLAERWDGHAWRLVDTPVVGGSSHWVEQVPVPGAGMWSVGGFSSQTAERPLVMRRDPNGSWRHVPAPSPDVHLAFLSGADAVSRTDVWAVGPATSGPLALHWNGRAWSMVATG